MWRCLLAMAMVYVSIVWAAGCASDPTEGYVFGSTYREGVATVAVPIFENDTYHRDIEFELTDAVVKEIESRTPYKVTSAVRADTILSGTIRRVEIDHLSRSPRTGLTEESVLSVTIDFEWTDLRTNRPLVKREQYAGHGLFVPSRPSGEPIELGRFAVVQKLASDIVNEMQAEW